MVVCALACGGVVRWVGESVGAVLGCFSRSRETMLTSWSTVIGVSLTILASTMNALGLNFQRLAGRAVTGARCPPKALNALGIFLSTSCGIVDVISFGYASQTLLAPLGVVTLVVNLILAPVMHGEAVAFADGASTLIIVLGVVLCVTSGNSDEQSYSLDDLRHLASSPSFHMLVVVTGALFAVLGAHVWLGEANGREAQLSTGIAYPICAGMLAGSAVLGVKILTVVLSRTTNFAIILPIGLCVAVFALSQVVVNNRGLSKHSALVLVPIFSSTFAMSNAIGGGIFFQDFQQLPTHQWRTYCSGFALIISGVLAMAVTAISKQTSLETKSRKN